MEYQYITFKPEGKKELKMSMKKFQDLHPEIDFYAFFNKHMRTSGIFFEDNVTAERMFLASLHIPDGIPVEICTFLRDYVDYNRSNITISVTLKDIVNALLYKNQEINLIVNESDAKKSYLPYIISAYKVNTVNGITPNEFLQRRKIYLEALDKIEDNSQVDLQDLFEIALEYDVDSDSLAKIAEKSKSSILGIRAYAPHNKRINRKLRNEKVLLQSYFEKFTKEEIEFILQLDIIPNRENLIIYFSSIPDDKLARAIECFRGKENIILRISAKDAQRILDKNLSFKKVNVEYGCDLVSEAQEDFINRFDTCEITISHGEINPTIVNINGYKILLRRLRKIVRGISLDAPEKNKFKKIYTRLAKKLEYDNGIIIDSEELAEYQEENALSSRNLENALLQGRCVCAGMAETLRQALSLVNINCLTCISKSVIEDGKDEAHMYNLVKIDGQWYNADLTWDRANIRRGKYPKYCLKSDEDFTNVKEEDKPFHTREPYYKYRQIICDKSLELFKKEKTKKKIKEKLRAIRKFLIKANILKANQSNTPLLPEASKSKLWRKSIEIESVQAVSEKAEEAEKTSLDKNHKDNERYD